MRHSDRMKLIERRLGRELKVPLVAVQDGEGWRTMGGRPLSEDELQNAPDGVIRVHFADVATDTPTNPDAGSTV